MSKHKKIREGTPAPGGANCMFRCDTWCDVCAEHETERVHQDLNALHKGLRLVEAERQAHEDRARMARAARRGEGGGDARRS